MEISVKVCMGISKSVSTLHFPLLGLLLSNPYVQVGGTRMEDVGSCDINGYWLTNQVIFVVQCIFSQLASTVKSGNTNLTYFDNAWSKTRKHYPRELLGSVKIVEKDASCV
jgi:hypothetical protein